MADGGAGLAVVTGALDDVGFEVARCFTGRGFDLLVAAGEPRVATAADVLRGSGRRVVAVRTDLARPEGVEHLVREVRATGRPVEALAVTTGPGADGPFATTDVEAHLASIGLRVAGAVHLVHRLLGDMVARGSGRILFVAPPAGSTVAPLGATTEAATAFLRTFAHGLRAEVAPRGVTVAAVLPGEIDLRASRVPVTDVEVARAAFAAVMADAG